MNNSSNWGPMRRVFVGFLMMFMIVVIFITIVGVHIGSAEVHTTGPISASEQTPSFTITSSSQYFHTPPSNISLWDCFDHSMNYSLHNPLWGMVCISSNPRFKGRNHVVNYQIDYSDNTLIIHDSLLENDYRIEGWEYDSCTINYYHFYIDSEKPTRHYNKGNLKIRPNAEEVYRDWVLTR